MQAYSMDLRVRVLADCDLGMKPSVVSEKYRVSTRWVQKLLKRRRETGQIEPRRGKTGPKPKWVEQIDEIRGLVCANPDATLEEYAQLFAEHLNLHVCYGTVWRIFKKLNITFKKNAACHGTAATGRQA